MNNIIFDKNIFNNNNNNNNNDKNFPLISKFKRNKNLYKKIKYPSLFKTDFSLPVNEKKLICNTKYPILEEKNFLEKKNLNLNLTVKNIILNKKLINVPKYKHLLPTFKINKKFSYLNEIQKEKNYKKNQEKKFDLLNHKDQTNENFFKIVKNNINNEKKFLYVRNLNNFNKNFNKNEEKIFLTNFNNKNKNNNNENFEKNKNKNENENNKKNSFINSQKKFIKIEKLIRKKDLTEINISFKDEIISNRMKEFNKNLSYLLKTENNN